MSKMGKASQTLVWLPLSALSVVWAVAQRPLDMKKVREIADNFDPDVFGALIVTNQNGDGLYHIVDGQHRKIGAELALGKDQRAPCIVIDAPTPQDAAEAWLKLNMGRTRPSAVSSFRVALTAGHPTEVAVHEVLKSLGYRVGSDSGEGVVRSVAACMAVYRQHGAENFRDTMLAIKQIWGRDPAAVDGYIIGGVAAVLREHADAIDHGRLRAQLQKRYTPVRSMGAARSARELEGGNMVRAVAKVIINAYNIGLKNGRLGTNP